MKKEVAIKCNKCGVIAPKIEDANKHSNWVLFDTSKPCECGGQFIPILDK